MADIRRDLERFLRQQLFRKREQPLLCFALRSAGVGSRGTPVDSFDVPPDFDGDQVGIMVDDILVRAQADADALGTKLQRYVLFALEAGKKDGPRFAFRLRGEGDEDGEDGEEPATEKGLLSQLMRHNEALARMNTMMMGSAMGAMASRLTASEKHVENLLEQRFKDMRALEEAQSLQHDRDMQALITSGQEERKSELFKKLEMILPLVVNKIAGRNLLPAGPESNVFDALANSLTGDQLSQIAQFLTQEQQVLLLSLLKAAREKHAANGVS